MKLSVVILNYNVQHFLQICLESVEAAITNLDAEIIVVDNQSSDESCNMVKQNFHDVILIENSENLGFAKGNNIGVSKAKGDYVCILNPDTVVAEDTFTKTIKFAEQQNDLGIVGCRLIDGKGNFLPESKRNVPKVGVAFQKMIGNATKYYANHVSELQSGKVDVLVGAFMLLKRNVYNKVAGFDEDYFMYGEDIDLSYKVLKAGFNNYYFGETSIIHYKGESTLKDKTYAKRFYGAMKLFYKKHFKKNIIFDALVWTGINLAYTIRKNPKEIKTNPETYVFVSDSDNKKLKAILNKEIEVRAEIDGVKDGSEIIFNTNHVSFKEMIDIMSASEIQKRATFKILSKNGTFVLGSNDSKNRGEVIFL